MAEPVLDNNNEVKQRAIKRLIIAVGLVFVAIGILTYLSYYKPASKVITKPAPDTLAPPPPPIVTGPEPSAIEPAPLDQALPEPPPPAEAPPLEPPPPAPTAAPVGKPAPPPPPVVVSKPLPKPGPGPDKSLPPPTQPAQPLIKADAPPPAATSAVPGTAPATKPAPTPSAFVVQFGVFSTVQNALQLVERLKAAGIAAQTETRVQLPPFQSKAEAEAALAKMKEKGINATLVTK